MSAPASKQSWEREIGREFENIAHADLIRKSALVREMETIAETDPTLSVAEALAVARQKAFQSAKETLTSGSARLTSWEQQETPVKHSSTVKVRSAVPEEGSQQDWVNHTPEESGEDVRREYGLYMMEDPGPASQWIDLTREELLLLKGCLAALRGLGPQGSKNTKYSAPASRRMLMEASDLDAQCLAAVLALIQNDHGTNSPLEAFIGRLANNSSDPMEQSTSQVSKKWRTCGRT
jgi:hypothetical protein